MLKYDFYRGCNLPSNGTITNVALRALDLNFQSHSFRFVILESKGWKNAYIIIAIRQQVRYLPSIGATANVVHRNLDLHFQGHAF